MTTNKLPKTILVLAFLTAILAMSQFANLGKANPFRELGSVPPDASTKPPKVAIFSPSNGSAFASNQIPLSINVTLPESLTASNTILYTVSYRCDWQENESYLYVNLGYDNSIEKQMTLRQQFLLKTINLTDVPNGNHSLTVTADAGGSYRAQYVDPPGFYRFKINGTSTVFFSAETEPLPTATPRPTATQTNQNDEAPVGMIFPAATAILLLICLAIAVLLYYRRKAQFGKLNQSVATKN